MSEFNYKKYLAEGRLLREETKARKLGITDFPYIEKDKNGNITYKENEYGFFQKFEYFPDNRLKGTTSGYGSHYPKLTPSKDSKTTPSISLSSEQKKDFKHIMMSLSNDEDREYAIGEAGNILARILTDGGAEFIEDVEEFDYNPDEVEEFAQNLASEIL